MRRNTVDDFWTKVDIQSDDQCWLWQGTVFFNGYGRFWLNDKDYGAHVLSWELANKQRATKGLEVRHTCFNKRCVNPAHLQLDTHFKNKQDVDCTDLTINDVLQIRILYKVTPLSQREIGKIFNRSQGHIGRIIRGERWNDVA